MKIDFEITTVPDSEKKKYLAAYLEGVLTISVDDVLLFDQPGILLVELANFIEKWRVGIRSNEKADFKYESMEHDEPILLIKHVENGLYRIDSVWKEVDVRLLTEGEIAAEFERYLDNLADALKVRCNIELKDFML